MPTQTFFNLAKEKQDNIICTSKIEFTKYGFYEASINRIIKDVGISRGSFYQYFENKEDLFIYILNNTRQLLMSSISKKIANKKCSFFDLHLLIFDEITNINFVGEDKDFIITTISNFDIKLINHLFVFLVPKDPTNDINEIRKIVDFDNIRLTTVDEMMNLHSILMNSMMSQLVVYFTKMYTLEDCRKNLLIQFDLIKYGVLKQ